ncbi:MAG: S-methyl-5-thioribose-1-phosphate isomerase [Acidimicrobiia bacterium]|nr:S-methyl-5-thioribose-1-phosphate isomerase [Acidimicrobiia bacterium]
MQTIVWNDDAVDLIDQTKLPHELTVFRAATVAELIDAIKRLVVRGAPAIGVAGGYGVVLAMGEADPITDPDAFARLTDRLRNARPTAVNLAVRVDEVLAVAGEGREAALATAHRIKDDEIRSSTAMGERGADLVVSLVEGRSVRAMTICNTGGLATVDRGTALAVIQTLHERGDLEIAYPLETRPLLQGARLTTWELGRMGAPYRLVVDSAGPALISRGLVDVVVAGADRIASNGDVANKIGTYSLALAAHRSGVPFLIVAPESTVDGTTATGADIDIELRAEAEVTGFGEVRFAPADATALNPAFDVTPAELITAIVTDQRVVRCQDGERPE